MKLWHAYHVFADGDWRTPVEDHFDALIRYGLAAELSDILIGFVGSRRNIAEAEATVDDYGLDYTVVARKRYGWEQETLTPLWRFVQTHSGLVSYAHTKGAANYNPINWQWRREMTYHNFVQWQKPVQALEHEGKSIVGCHWYEGQGAETIPGFGHGGMFGGNFWWTRCELLRQNCRPSMASRMHAEHWLGQLSEVMPITGDTILDLNPRAIGGDHRDTDW